MESIGRRRMLLGTAGAAVGIGAGIRPQPAPAQAAEPVRMRVNVGALPADSPVLESYRRAIAAMKALPESDPRNWTRMARVHLDACPHNNWFLLPWHRAYLTSFERVCRQLSGDANFRVPYWDWTNNRQIPVTFSQQTHNGQPNPLFLPTDTTPPFPDSMNPATAYRARLPNSAMQDFAVGGAIIDAALAEPNFERFAGSRPRQGSTPQNDTSAAWLRRFGTPGPLESNPHNYVHGFVGGTMGTFMSPLDPLFWLHHANLDRLWDRWVRPGFANSTDPLWLNFRFSGQFVTATGAAWAPRVRDLLDPRALGYAYRATAAFPFPQQDVRLLRSLPRIDPGQLVFRTADVAPGATVAVNQVLAVRLPTARTPSEITARVLPADQPLPGLRARTAPAAAGTPVATGRVLATVEAEIPAGPTPHVRVFLSCPYLSPDTPATDPHFVGSFAFFATEHDEATGHGAGHGSSDAVRSIRVSLDLTRTLAALRETGRTPTDGLQLQLLPVPLEEGGTPPAVRVRRVEFATT